MNNNDDYFLVDPDWDEQEPIELHVPEEDLCQ